MSDKASDVPSQTVPFGANQDALVQFYIEEMTERVEPAEGMSQYAPTLSPPLAISETSLGRGRDRDLIIRKPSGISRLPSRERRRREQSEERRKDKKRKWLEEMRRLLFYWPPLTREPSLEPSLPAGDDSSNSSSIRSKSRVVEITSCTSSGLQRERTNDFRGRTRPNVAHNKPPPIKNSEMSPERASDWNHSAEFHFLRKKALEAARFRPERRNSNDTFDINAFSDEAENKKETKYVLPSNNTIPTNFPPHRIVDGITELSSYLASSSYIVSLGGPPLPDLKYGIIIVPTGEEDLLFTEYGNRATFSADLKNEVHAKSNAIQLENETPMPFPLKKQRHISEKDESFPEGARGYSPSFNGELRLAERNLDPQPTDNVKLHHDVQAPEPELKAPINKTTSRKVCNALELLLKVEGKSYECQDQISESSLSSTKFKSSEKPPGSRRDFLLEVARAITNLANGKLDENPGIDPSIWETTQAELGFQDEEKENVHVLDSSQLG